VIKLWGVDETSWKLEELAKRAGVSARTIRYYVQRGLLPAPEFHGRDTTYNDHHLSRLKAIRKLQERFLPLDAIEQELSRRSAEEIRKLGESVGVVRGHHPYREPPAPRPAPAPAPVESWRRIELAPGLEIHVSDRADAMTRSLAEELRALVERRQNGGAK
jgi:DNA-binding transcriptional MerR regulator